MRPFVRLPISLLLCWRGWLPSPPSSSPSLVLFLSLQEFTNCGGTSPTPTTSVQMVWGYQDAQLASTAPGRSFPFPLVLDSYSYVIFPALPRSQSALMTRLLSMRPITLMILVPYIIMGCLRTRPLGTTVPSVSPNVVFRMAKHSLTRSTFPTRASGAPTGFTHTRRYCHYLTFSTCPFLTISTGPIHGRSSRSLHHSSIE